LPKVNSHELYKLNHRINDNGIIERRCTNCQKWLEENAKNYYYVNKKKQEYRFMSECKQCSKIRSRKITIKNPEKRKIYYDKFNNKPEIIQIMRKASEKQRKDGKQAIWQKDHPDKLKIYNNKREHKIHDISKKEWISCKEYFSNTCAYCGLPLTEHWITYRGVTKLGDFHKDHKDHNGANDLSNCIPACESCNCKKWEHPFEEWYTSDNPVFSQERLNKINKWLQEDYKLYTEDKPPYKIIRKRNKGLTTYHYELWTVDEKRNLIQCIEVKNKKKDINIQNL
jgi:hypothetical protein